MHDKQKKLHFWYLKKIDLHRPHGHGEASDVYRSFFSLNLYEIRRDSRAGRRQSLRYVEYIFWKYSSAGKNSDTKTKCFGFPNFSIHNSIFRTNNDPNKIIPITN